MRVIVLACALWASNPVSAAPETYYFFHCGGERGKQDANGPTATFQNSAHEVPRCSDGGGNWVAVTYPPTDDQIAWDSVVTASAMALFMWSIGVGVGMVLNMVKRSRF